MSDTITTLKEQLLKSHWPKCNAIASEIMSFNNIEAKEALIEALKAKRHHIRTAAIQNLISFNDKSVASYIKPLLDDPSYETRIQAKEFFKIVMGEDVLTSRGE